MRTRMMVMAAVMTLTVMASARVARAQQSMVVNIPFDFVAGNQVLPAGDYAVERVGHQNTLVLVNRAYSLSSPFLNTNAIAANKIQTESRLIFNRYGDRYFLSQIWTAGDSRGRELPKSAREKEIALVAEMEAQGQITLVAELSPTTR
ncbi:MAG TPA: hypothetical protein VMI32_05240 [Candidatus Solibacter sp.]|nr:hypothetical protein [Candidatus Solibacter sp.]